MDFVCLGACLGAGFGGDGDGVSREIDVFASLYRGIWGMFICLFYLVCWGDWVSFMHLCQRCYIVEFCMYTVRYTELALASDCRSGEDRN